MDDWGPPAVLVGFFAAIILVLNHMFTDAFQSQSVIDAMNTTIKVTERHCEEREKCASTVDIELPAAKPGGEYYSDLIIENHTTRDMPVTATIDQQLVYADEDLNLHPIASETAEVHLGFVEAGGTITVPYDITIPDEPEGGEDHSRVGGVLSVMVTEGAMAA